MTFELKLANGKALKTNHADELANFYESNGESIASAPTHTHKGKKRNKKGRKPAKAG